MTASFLHSFGLGSCVFVWFYICVYLSLYVSYNKQAK